MRLVAFSLALMANVPPVCWAKLGETEQQITQRYGEPVKIQNHFAERVFSYNWKEYVVGVSFMDGKCQKESYRHKDENTQFTLPEVTEILMMNSGGRHWRLDPNSWYVLGDNQIEAEAWYFNNGPPYQMEVYTPAYHEQFMKKLGAPISDLWTGKKLRFTGVLSLTHKEDGTCITVHSGGNVLEIPWSRRYLFQWVNLPVGKLCTITVKDRENVDVEPLIAFRSDREHRSREAMASDFFSVYRLVRIEEGKRVVWDRSICEVHHIKMQKITVGVAYGTFLFEGSDEVCNQRYPHHFDFAFGGDPVMTEDLNSPRVTQKYFCPKCAAECQIYKWMDPDFATR